MDEFDRLLTAWEDNTIDFMKWVEIVCGINKVSKTYLMLKENVVTMEDLALFIDCFRGDLDEIEYITEVFMERKCPAV